MIYSQTLAGTGPGYPATPSEFVWQMSSGCNSSDAHCDAFYTKFDAPLRSSLCLARSSEECSIWYKTNLNYGAEQMCANEYDLWIDLTLGHNWYFRQRSTVALLAVGADLVECSNYTIAGVPRDRPDIGWCNKLPPPPADSKAVTSELAPLGFHSIIFSDKSGAVVPNGVVLNKSRFLIIRSSDTRKSCWIAQSGASTLSIAAEFHKSNVGGLPPALESSLQNLETRSAIALVVVVLSAVVFLVMLRKFRQAALINMQEAAVALYEKADPSKQYTPATEHHLD